MNIESAAPFVTVGIPLYNGGKFIDNTIKSVLCQTYKNFELIITDDGSTDDSVEIVKSFNDFRIKLLVDGNNRGISHRLNQQINMSKGKYFVRMDADDLMFPDRLQRQISFLEENPDIDAVGSSVVVVDDNTQIIAFRSAKLAGNFAQLFKSILLNHPTVTGKTAFFKKYPYSNRFLGVEDADLWLRSFPKSKFFVMEEPSLFYRDPLKFNLKTYQFRIDQKNKLIVENQYLRNRPFLKFQLISQNMIKKILAELLTFINKGDLMIAQRNNVRTPIKEEWKIVLEKIINGK